ncbi:XRE family transcriptional regulator [uncultured Cohaesibacter sp.]|uniref:helix-turn-helix domain-containing protein n=1 Tax=uncultured Cohaesibacter sp. TaxID=1002546 RepID=UPI0029C62AB4|nr:XRE family transcriptional regulator [uncultured Cohaesibacter sp.]
MSVEESTIGLKTDRPSSVAQILRELRKANGWTLADVSNRTGVSISSLSKIENGQSQPAYSVLIRLASGLDVDFAELVSGEAPRQRCVGAARAISRAGDGKSFSNDMGVYELLSTELAAKLLQPMVIELKARDTGTSIPRSSHLGEEFVYVLEGNVVFEMEPYSPTILSTGDSVYFDATQTHSFYSAGPESGRILSICSADAVARFTENLDKQ